VSDVATAREAAEAAARVLVGMRSDGGLTGRALGELRYDEPDPSLPDLLVCRPDLSERIVTAVR
jgi:3'(2'), 5'-bisphosphate nucleotidase